MHNTILTCSFAACLLGSACSTTQTADLIGPPVDTNIKTMEIDPQKWSGQWHVVSFTTAEGVTADILKNGDVFLTNFSGRTNFFIRWNMNTEYIFTVITTQPHSTTNVHPVKITPTPSELWAGKVAKIDIK